jgi:hypothetical protein
MTDKQKRLAIGAAIVVLILLLLWAWLRRRAGLSAIPGAGLPDFTFTMGDIIVQPPGGYTIDLITQAPAVYVINGQACGCGCDSLTLEAPNLDYMIDGLNQYLEDNARANMAGLYALYGIDYNAYAGGAVSQTYAGTLYERYMAGNGPGYRVM